MFKILIGVIIVAVGALITFMVIDPNIGITSTDNASTPSSSTEVAEGYFAVAIEGEVNEPGNYTLEDGSTIGDLISAAGGTTEYADSLAYFTTTVLEEGKTYYIASQYDTSNVCSLVNIQKVNINKDTADVIASIDAIKTSVANSIVSYRVEKGEFTSLEDLEKVYGIGPATYRNIRNYVILHE